MAISDRTLTALSDLAARQREHTDKAAAYRALLSLETAGVLFECLERARDADAVREALSDISERIPQLCRSEVLFYLLEKTRESGDLPFENYPKRLPERPKLCRLAGVYSEEAADASGISADWYYAESFEDAAEMTQSGEVNGCLLPFLDENGRQMQGVLRMIYENGLQKSAVYHLATELQTCTYGLFTGKTCFLPGADLGEVLVYPKRFSELSDCMALFARLGVDCALSASPEGKTGRDAFEQPCRLTLSGNGKKLEEAFRGLYLMMPETTVCGVYAERYFGSTGK